MIVSDLLLITSLLLCAANAAVIRIDGGMFYARFVATRVEFDPSATSIEKLEGGWCSLLLRARLLACTSVVRQAPCVCLKLRLTGGAIVAA